MRDLTIRVPATMNDNQGGALQSEQDLSRTSTSRAATSCSDGAPAILGGTTFHRWPRLRLQGGFDRHRLSTGTGQSGAPDRAHLDQRSLLGCRPSTTQRDDARPPAPITDPLAYGVRVTDGGFAVVDNSGHRGRHRVSRDRRGERRRTWVIATIRHTTIVGPPPDQNAPAVKAVVQNAVGNGFDQPRHHRHDHRRAMTTRSGARRRPRPTSAT